MRQVGKQGQLFSRRVVTDAGARAELAGEPYKLELVGLKGGVADDAGRSPTEVSAEESVEVGGGGLTIYDNLDRETGERRWEGPWRRPPPPRPRADPPLKLVRRRGGGTRARA